MGKKFSLEILRLPIGAKRRSKARSSARFLLAPLSDESDTEPLRGSLQPAVQGPEKRFMEASRGKQMDVDETESDSHEPMDIEEAQNFFWIGSGGLRQ